MKELASRFYEVLWTVTTDRDKHPGKDEHDNPAWVQHERAVMLAEVNKERAKRALDPVTVAEIARGEVVGHPAYGRALAEHCARLAVGGEA